MFGNDSRASYTRLVRPGTAEELQEVLRQRVTDMDRLSWDELDAYGERVEEITLPSGQEIRVRTKAFWDMEPWQSDMHIVAQGARLARRVGRAWPYREHRLKRGEDLPR